MHTNFATDDVMRFHNDKYGGSYPATLSNVEGLSLGTTDLDDLLAEILQLKGTGYAFPVTFSPNLTTN